MSPKTILYTCLTALRSMDEVLLVGLRVEEVWRYPVKSLQGECIDKTVIDEFGLVGDRRYAIIDVDTGLGLTARRMPELLYASASWNKDGTVRITLPDGTTSSDDEMLSAWLGRSVALKHCRDAAPRRYENVLDFETERSSEWTVFEGASGPFHDSSGARVSLISTGTIGAHDRRRFRPNLVLHGSGEDDLVGARVKIGNVVLNVSAKIQRCVVVTRPQPGGLGRDLDLLRSINRLRNGRIAIGAVVDAPGVVSVGDEVTAVANAGEAT